MILSIGTTAKSDKPEQWILKEVENVVMMS